MESQFTEGEKLIIELTSGEVIEAEYVDGGKHRLEIRNITEYPSGACIPGTLCYYQSEIKSVKTLDSTSQPDSGNEAPINDGCILLKESEFDRLKNMARTSLYIATMDKRYCDAVEYLASCETVGVVLVGTHLGREGNPSLLVMASWDQVYMFDLFLYSQNTKTFPKELKEILESEAIRKVLHDARPVVDCLQNLYNIKIAKLYDTKIADVMIMARETGKCPNNTRSLSDCLKHYLHFPESILENAKITSPKWGDRPLKSSQKTKATLLGLYLITLKNTTEDLLLKDFYNVMKCDIESAINVSAVHCQMILQKSELSEETKVQVPLHP